MNNDDYFKMFIYSCIMEVLITRGMKFHCFLINNYLFVLYYTVSNSKNDF